MVTRAFAHLPAVALALAMATHATGAHAQANETRFSWTVADGTSECPSAETLAAAASRMIGAPLEATLRESHMRVDAEVMSTAPARFRVVVRATGDDGEALGRRELDAEFRRCSALRTPVALVLSLLVRSAVTLRLEQTQLSRDVVDEPASSASGSHDDTAQPTTTAPAPAHDSDDHDDALHNAPLALRIAGGAAAGLLPGIAFTLTGGFDVALGPLRVGADMLAFFPHASEHEGTGALFSALCLAPGVGWRALDTARVTLEPFAGLAVCGHRVSAYGAPAPTDHISLIVAARAGLHAGVRIARRLAITLSASLLVPTRRLSFYYVDGAGNDVLLHRIKQLAPALELGLRFDLP